MSRAYRISASESTQRHVVVEDGVCTALEMLEVLPQESMCELLAAELEKRGFKRDGDIAKRVDKDGVEITVNLKDGAVNVRLAAERDIEVKVERSALVAEESVDAQERLNAETRRAMEKQVDQRTEKARQDVTARLEKKLKELQSELDQVSNRVTAEALKVKAKQLGDIEEITEDANGSMTIKVRT